MSFVVPSKYDIIPIHNSDRGSFKRCRRYWDWTSPARNNLTLRAEIYGVNIPLWFGTGIHWALEQFYTPISPLAVRRDPVEAWTTWFDIQWRGGTVTEDWLDRVHDLKPRQVADNTVEYQPWGLSQPVSIGGRLCVVRGLEDILPDADGDVFDELRILGIEMMTFYKQYAAKNDGFEVLMVEHDFSIPIWDYGNDTVLKAVDLREHSPNYGKLLEVHQRGRMDAVWRSLNGKIGVLDHKTSARPEETADEEKLQMDEQVTTYLYAAAVEAKLYGLPWAGEIIEECIYNVLRKAYPKPPNIVRGGLFSIDREKETATYTMYVEWLAQQSQELRDKFNASEKHTEYLKYVRDIGDEQFIIRRMVRRNQHQLRNAGYRAYQEAMDMLNPDLSVYPTIDGFDFLCRTCAFRAPCMAQEDGGDYQDLIASNYSRNRDR